MASENFYNTGDEWMPSPKKDSHRFMKKRAMVRNTAPKLYSGAEKAYNRMKPEEQKQVQRKLQNLQKKNPKLSAALAAKKPSAVVGLAKNLLGQIDWTVDWLFILLFSFALLKDIFDIVFAAAGTTAGSVISLVPGFGMIGGAAMAAIGMTISFTGDLMFLILTVTVLVLVGSSIKNRGPAKYFIGTAIEFIAEALPGISWLPWTVVYVFILYFCVLYDRAYSSAGQTAQVEQADNNADIPATASGATAKA